MGCHALLQGIFPTQGSNVGLPHCRRILYHLSHQGRPGILEWVAYPFPSGPSRLWNRTGVSGIAGEFFTSWAIREALFIHWYALKPKIHINSSSDWIPGVHNVHQFWFPVIFSIFLLAQNTVINILFIPFLCHSGILLFTHIANILIL